MQDLDIVKKLRACASSECSDCPSTYSSCVEFHKLAADRLEIIFYELESFHVALSVLRGQCHYAKGITKLILTAALKLFPDATAPEIPAPSRGCNGYDYQLCPDYDALASCLKELSCRGYPLLAVSQWDRTYTVFFQRPLP